MAIGNRLCSFQLSLVQFTSTSGSPPSGPKVDLSFSCTWFGQRNMRRSNVPSLKGEASPSITMSRAATAHRDTEYGGSSMSLCLE